MAAVGVTSSSGSDFVTVDSSTSSSSSDSGDEDLRPRPIALPSSRQRRIQRFVINEYADDVMLHGPAPALLADVQRGFQRDVGADDIGPNLLLLAANQRADAMAAEGMAELQHRRRDHPEHLDW